MVLPPAGTPLGWFVERMLNFKGGLDLNIEGALAAVSAQYQAARSLRDNLELYDREEFQCGNWTRVPADLWRERVSSDITAYPQWWNLLSNFTPFETLSVCTIYPDTCDELFPT